jgi:hypothetical protein
VKPKVYLETTIPSMLVARLSRNVLVAGQQQATRDWWAQRRPRFDLYVSVFVTREIAQGDAAAAQQRAAVIADCGILPFTKEAEVLTRALLASRLIPARAETDAAHVAVAAVEGMDFLLTWNCRHIANAVIVEKLRAVCAREGYAAPVICTPHELMI